MQLIEKLGCAGEQLLAAETGPYGEVYSLGSRCRNGCLVRKEITAAIETQSQFHQQR